MKITLLGRVFLLAALAAPNLAHAAVKPNSLFTDSAVLQRDKPVPIWGTADEGEKVTVQFAGQKVSTVTKEGKWLVILAPLKTNARPAKMTITGQNTIVLNDLLVGEVWIASGQSNMERQLGPRDGQKEIEGWREAAASANLPQIRQFYVPLVSSITPKNDVNSKWVVCTPQTAPDFSAVGFFFARALQQKLNVPVGVIFSAWGGTFAEAWTSGPSLKTMPDFAPAVAQVEAAAAIKDEDYGKALANYWAKTDPGSAPGQSWAAPEFDASNWKPITGSIESPGANFDGLFWMRREIELPLQSAGKVATLRLGAIDDNDTTFVNGVQIGATEGWEAQREYHIPANLLRAGRNVIAVRAVDTGGGGGFSGDASAQQIEVTGFPAIPLAGNWKFQTSIPIGQLGAMPRRATSNPNTATVLYNGMIAPLVPVAFKGVIWYQGESNNDRATQYQTLFPLMISDWRKSFGQGDFPFLFVQIAPFNGMSPEIREAQFLTLQKLPNTAMAVTNDIGDANDIHPANKRPVGERLALAARALGYGEKTEYSGPLYQGMKVQGNRAVISFSHVGGGLVAKDGPLKGFQIAGIDGKLVPAVADIVGNTVVVSAQGVTNPNVVRYGWANVPDVNLFNFEGLPASSFRTDNGPRTTRADASHDTQQPFAQWTQQAAERIASAQGKSIDVMFIGDSITQNFIESPSNGWNLVGRSAWDKYYGLRKALNIGSGGDGTEHILWRLQNPNVAGFRPKVVVLLAGINDQNELPADIAAGVKAVIAQIQALYPGVKIISVSILPSGRTPTKMKAANAIIRTFADNRSVFYLDLEPKMTNPDGSLKGIGGDQVHLTLEGYEIWASEMEPLLNKLLAG